MSQRNNNLITGDTFSIPDDMVDYYWQPAMGFKKPPRPFSSTHKFLGLEQFTIFTYTSEIPALYGSVNYDGEDSREGSFPEISAEQAMTLMYKNLRADCVWDDAAMTHTGNTFSFKKEDYIIFASGDEALNFAYVNDNYDIWGGPGRLPTNTEKSTGIMEYPWQTYALSKIALSERYERGGKANGTADSFISSMSVQVSLAIIRDFKRGKFYLFASSQLAAWDEINRKAGDDPEPGDSLQEQASTRTADELESGLGGFGGIMGNLIVEIPSPTKKEYKFPLYTQNDNHDLLPYGYEIRYKTKDARIGNENW